MASAPSIAIVLALGGCGRIGFDEVRRDATNGDTNSDAATLVACHDDSFDDGAATDWTAQEGAWVVQPTAGPDGSPALAATALNSSVVTHPSLAGVRAARVTLDVRIDGAIYGDFVIEMTRPGGGYAFHMHPAGSDDLADGLRLRLDPAQFAALTSRPASVVPGTWHRVVFSFGVDRAMTVELDGASYLQSAPDTTLSPPFDVFLVFWDPGAIDNVSVQCAR